MRRSFTLLELIIVIIVVGILATVAIGQYIKITEKARAAEGRHILDTLRGSQVRYGAEHSGTYATDIALLDAETTTPQNFGTPTVANDSTALVTVTRKAGTPYGEYVLSIDVDGVITCSGGGTGGCEAAGF